MGSDPIARGEHLPRHLGIPPLVRLQQRQASKAREEKAARQNKKQEQRQDELQS